MNVALLKKIQKRITKKPDEFHMSAWVDVDHSYRVEGFCETTACLAGHAVLLDEKLTFDQLDRMSAEKISKAAAEALDIPIEDANALFHRESWPVKWSRPYINAFNSGKVDRAAEIASDFIDEVIKRGRVPHARDANVPDYEYIV